MTDRDLTEHTNSLASYLVGGDPTSARFNENKNLRKLIKGLSVENKRIEDTINLILTEHNINTTTLFIDEWESALGIPDECFRYTTTLPIEQRRAQIAAKIFMRQCTTIDDFYTLKNILYPLMPMTHEYVPGEYFTLRIHLPGSVCTQVFPLPFPLPFGGCLPFPLVCIFNKVKSANSKIIYIYDLP